MEEQVLLPEQEPVHEQPVEQQPEKRPKRRVGRWIFGIIFLALGAYLLYTLYDLYLTPDRNIQQVYLVPEDAAFIIQSADPVRDWQRFSSSETWQTMKEAGMLADIVRDAEFLDSMIVSNKTLLSLVGKRDLLISVHQTQATKWDFLMILDMKKASKLDLLKNQIETVLKMMGNEVTSRTYNNVRILEMREKESRNILYLAFVDNHLVASYTPRLVNDAIDARENPSIGLNDSFLEAERLVGTRGLVRVFVNYAALPQFLSVFFEEESEWADLFSRSMSFAGLYYNLEKEQSVMEGYSYLKEEADPYMRAILHSGKHRMKAQEILPVRTAVYAHIGVSDMTTFVKELETAMAQEDPKIYKSYRDMRKQIEDGFEFSLDEYFLSWMSGELVVAQAEAGLLGREPEQLLVVGAKDIGDAKKKMAYLERLIRKRTPIRISSVNYKGFDVNYIEMKGFFRLFFGKLLDKFEKPFYTYVDDYVVFSTSSSTLLSFLEDYSQKNLLKNSPEFKRQFAQYSNSATLFLYTDMHRVYPQLRKMLHPATWTEIQRDKDILYSFPYLTLQLAGNDNQASLTCRMAYEAYEPEAPVSDADEADKEMKEDAETERELMSELKRFYVEKFQGNVLREFHDDGAVRVEAETKEGQLHGRYREFYVNGQLKLRGKYVRNQAKGTWKYYTTEGKFDRKQKF